MADDRLNELTPVPINFTPGERPTDEKLKGMMKQVETGFDFVELSFGDLYNESGIGPVWVNNLARDLGDRSKLNPVLPPDVNLSIYEQSLESGKCEHELDMIPVGSGSGLIVATTDPSVIPGQYKAAEDLLEVPGDWTIRAGLTENGQQKNSRKLITHQPSNGGSITFADVTSGKGSAYYGAKWNTIPTVAQAEAGGDFPVVSLSDAINNVYTFVLPVHTQTFDRVYNNANTTASNTAVGITNGSSYELPEYLFDSIGLNLQIGDDIPLGSIRIYDWVNKKMVDGLLELQASGNPAALRSEFLVKFSSDVLLDTVSGQYIVVTSGVSLYDMVAQLQRDVYFHNHDGDDMIRLLSHKSLMDLRTGNTNVADRSSWYGTSNIDNNDHSMYLHRDGFTDSDIGAGGNVMRGAVVLGSTTTGAAGDHENYNLDSDSFKVSFGKLVDGGEIYFDKVWDQTLTQGRGLVPQVFSDTAIVVKGALDDATMLLRTTAVEGNLRVTDNVVLGTTSDHDVLVGGDLYVYQSFTLTPKNASEQGLIPGETGKMIYSSVENAPLFWNGSAWVNPASTGYSTTVGDGVSSFGKHNGNTEAPIQAAIGEVEAAGGGRVIVMRGTYNISNPVVLTTAELEGEGQSTLLAGTGTIIQFANGSSGSALKDMKISGGTIGLDIDGELHDIDNVVIESCTTGRVIRSNCTNLNSGGGVRFLSCDKDEQNDSENDNNYEMARNPIGYHNSFYVLDPTNKKDALTKFRRTGGSGVITYEDTADSGMGRGRYAITGTGTWVVDEFMPMISGLGVGGNILYKASAGGGLITFGVQCYDGNMSSLGTNGGFLLNQGGASTAWQLIYDHMRYEAASGASAFKVGTKFIKPYVQVDSNPGTVYLDGFNIQPLNFAVRALYS